MPRAAIPPNTRKKGLILAAKLIRQPDQLILIGAPTSAGAAAAGVERGSAALREAGIAERLRELGYEVNDTGDLPETLFQPDPENPRARNLKEVLSMLDVLRVRVEQSARAHALPVVLGGDETIAVALMAGLRRQAASLGLIHVGRYADLHTPMRTEDGLVEPMTVSHLVGQGAPEMVRFWKDPPLVREPDVVLFGLGESDEIDQERLGRLAVRRIAVDRIRREGVRTAAETALDRLRASSRDFVVHLCLDVFSPEEVPGCARSVAGGLTVAEVGDALNCFAARPSFAGLSISGYDSALDPDGRGAKAVVKLVVDALEARHTALLKPPEPEPEPETEQKTESEATSAEEGKSEKAAKQETEQPKPAAEAGEEAETAPAAEAAEEAQKPGSGSETEQASTPDSEGEASATASSGDSEAKNT